jgi:hypothetical protein
MNEQPKYNLQRLVYQMQTVEQLAKHRMVDNIFADAAEALDDLLPDNRDKVIAFEALETASMRYHKAIANERLPMFKYPDSSKLNIKFTK